MTVAILACGDGGVPPGIPDVIYVEDLCRKPGDLTPWLAGSERLVMIVHPAELALAQVQQSVRGAGLDPLGVHYVDAAAIAGDARRTTVLLAGALARVAAYVGSQPEHARPTYGGTRSRRELLSVPKPYYEAMPLVDTDICAAGSGCRACVTECPQSAYSWSRGKIRFDRDACVTCGRCVTACPTGAIGNPTVAKDALANQISALLSGAKPDPLGIAFVCRQRTRPVGSRVWAEVEVPCTGMVPATWPIAAYLLGAAGVAVVPCAIGGCALGNDHRAEEAVTLAAELLAAAGFDSAAVSAEPGELAGSIGPVSLQDPFGTHGPTEVALALASIAPTKGQLVASGSMASRGVVAIDTDACTVCLTCAETCPTGALGHTSESGNVTLMFDAARCTGCAQCVPVCPEIERGAIRVDRMIDTATILAGRRTLAESATAVCELCGSPIASAAMLERISSLLGAEHDATMRFVERRCMTCRGAV